MAVLRTAVVEAEACGIARLAGPTGFTERALADQCDMGIGLQWEREQQENSLCRIVNLYVENTYGKRLH